MDENNQYCFFHCSKSIAVVCELPYAFSCQRGYRLGCWRNEQKADNISRVQELFSQQKTQIYDVPYITLLKQVCLKHKEKRSWRVFHPSAQILSDLSCVLLSNYVTEVPKKTKNLGQFYPVESTFYGTAGSETSYPSSFL